MRQDEIAGYACPVCDTANPVSNKYCLHCGTWLLDTVREAKPLTQKEFKHRTKNNQPNLWKTLASVQMTLAIFMLLSVYSGVWFRLWVICYVAGIAGFNFLVGRNMAKSQEQKKGESQPS